MVRPDVALKKIARFGVLAIFLICGVALAGWLLGIAQLASIVPGWPRIALIVIFCFVLCGAALLEVGLPVRRRYFVLARFIAASIVLTIGAYSLIDFVVAGGLSGSGISGTTYLFGPRFGRPSPATAFN